MLRDVLHALQLGGWLLSVSKKHFGDCAVQYCFGGVMDENSS